MLQYITDYKSKVPVTEQVRKVLDGGCNWIQVSMPGASDDEISSVVEKIMPLCLEKEAFLILTDHVDLAKKLNVGGVALTLNPIDLPSKTRVFLGAAAVVGVSAHSFDDVTAVRSLDVDYINITPYRNGADLGSNAEPLGLDGVKNILNEMQAKDILTPAVVSGDVRFEDIDALMEAGAAGLTASSAIANADDITEETKRWVEKLAKYEHARQKALDIPE